MPSILALATGLSLLIWLYLILFHGGYWRARERLPETTPDLSRWPAVAAILPARDEAEVIGRGLGSVLAQDYPGRLEVFLVDDHSTDGTARAAREIAARRGQEERLSVVTARDLPAGWTGKLWALSEGLARADRSGRDFEYFWLSDADIEHDLDNLRRLVAKAQGEGRDLVSLMAALSCDSAWERRLIPPFVYFFQMLYPFTWVKDPTRRTAAAAGGCMLARAGALRASGGLEAIKDALIDDCALARRIKDLTPRGGPRGVSGGGESAGGGIWLGLATSARSIRPYRGLADIWHMVARTAYTQLGHNPLLLAGTLASMVLTYLVPPVALLLAPWHGDALVAALGGAGWLIMAGTTWPTYRAYGQAPWRCLTLPLAAALYGAMTFDSARRHWRGAGGAWKGRVHPAPRTLAPRRPEL